MRPELGDVGISRRDIMQYGTCRAVIAAAWPDDVGAFTAAAAALAAGRQTFAPTLILAIRGVETVGVAVYCNSPAADDIAEMTWLAVDPACRRAGIGRALVREAVMLAELRRRTLLCPTDTPEFYRRCGFPEPVAFAPGRYLFVVPHGTAGRIAA